MDRLLQHVEDRFGIRASARKLPSERDQNFLLSDDSGQRFVLKVANASESRVILEAQNAVMDYLSERVPFCQRVIGEIVQFDGHYVRLVTYLPGVPLAEINPHTPGLLHDLGQKLGQLSRALTDFDHPAVHRDFHWDLANGNRIVNEYAPLIEKAELRELVVKCRFEPETELRRSVIHGDANDYNVLVDPEMMTVSGLIDFGDMVYSYTVGDLAIALAYVALDKDRPRDAAREVISGYTSEFGLLHEEREALWPLVRLRLAMSICMAAYQQQQQPENEYLAISQKAIEKTLPRIYTDEYTIGDLMATRQRLLGRNLSVAYEKPLHIVRGSMQYLYDDEGRRYLDAYNNVAHVGHCHPKVVAAGQRQMERLNTNTRYLSELILEYAEKLTATLPESLSVCFFVNSGSEANELAIRLARAHTKARDMIVLEHAYHGNTTTLIDLSPYKHHGRGGEGAPAWVHTARLPVSVADAQHVIDIVQKLDAPLCGFIAESMPSVAGQIVLPDGYLNQVYDAVHGAGGVCITDEVQTGFGRIGTHFYAFEKYGVVPDIVVLGKPIGNGHPLGAVITTRRIAESFDNGMEFFSTFGGNNVSCAIGLKVLEVVYEENLQAHALKVGEHLLAGLHELDQRREVIREIRGSGFFLGVELVEEASLVVNQMRQRGILMGTEGPRHNVIKIRPPMPFTDSDADQLVQTLDEVLSRG